MAKKEKEAESFTTPTVRILSITPKGLMTFEFDQAMKVPFNETLIEDGTVKILNDLKPNLEIKMRPGRDSNEEKLGFDWGMVS